MSPPALYESAILQAVTGPTLRPGGLELTGRAIAFCRLPAGARVLDVGCGAGATAAHLGRTHGLKAFGLDRSAPLLTRALAEQGRLDLICADARCLPLADGAMNAVVAECVLSLLGNGPQILTEWTRVLQPGGFVVISDVFARNPGAVGGRCPAPGCLGDMLGREDIEARIAGAGLTIGLWEDHSDALKQLAARIVFACGSMAAFWSAWTGDGACAEAVRSARPGYYLTVARKVPQRGGAATQKATPNDKGHFNYEKPRAAQPQLKTDGEAQTHFQPRRARRTRRKKQSSRRLVL